MKRPLILSVFLALLPTVVQASTPALDWHLGAGTIATDCAAAVDRFSARVDEAARSRTQSAVALENAVADTRDALAAELFLWNVATDEGVRDASRSCRLRWRNALIEATANRSLYQAIAANAAPRTAFDRALAETWKSRMLRGGAALSPTRHEEYLQLAHELETIQDRFWTNVANDRTSIRIGRQTLAVDEGTNDLLESERDADVREAYERAYARRAAANLPLLARAIAIRDRMSHLLGFESWADYRLAPTMMGNLAAAQSFLHDAASAYETARPQSAAAWDAWRDLGTQSPRSIDAVLDTVGQSLGIRFERAAAGAWSSDAVAYTVVDSSGGRELGRLYLDLFRRPGKPALESVPQILFPRGDRGADVAIVAAWPARRDGLIEGDRVAALFGDAGRALSTLLAEVPYESLAQVPEETRELDAAFVERLAGVPAPLHQREVLARIALAQVDLAYYSSGSHVDTTRVWAQQTAATFPQLYDRGTYPQASTLALVQGLDGLTYALPWSQAIAADIFSAGGERYRRDVLAPAHSDSLANELRNLLGREPKPVMP